MTYLPNIALLILFGSQATGKTGALSDIDIAVLSDHSLSFEEKNAIGEYVALHYNFREDALDVIDIRNASPLLQHQIGEHGKLLQGDSDIFLRFRVLAWKRYQNTARFRRMRDTHLARIYG